MINHATATACAFAALGIVYGALRLVAVLIRVAFLAKARAIRARGGQP